LCGLLRRTLVQCKLQMYTELSSKLALNRTSKSINSLRKQQQGTCVIVILDAPMWINLLTCPKLALIMCLKLRPQPLYHFNILAHTMAWILVPLSMHFTSNCTKTVAPFSYGGAYCATRRISVNYYIGQASPLQEG
jgi:hypothetical protein